MGDTREKRKKWEIQEKNKRNGRYERKMKEMGDTREKRKKWEIQEKK